MRHLVNRIIVTQNYPNKKKIARVLALWKSEINREDISYYRHISLLSPLNKVFEGVLHIQINQYMKNIGLWNRDNNAYRANHSTTTALIDMTERWLENIENKDRNISSFLDLSVIVKTHGVIASHKSWWLRTQNFPLFNSTSLQEV